MRKGFFNGLLAGGFVGAVVGMFMAPQKKHYQREMISSGKQVQRQARRTMKGMRRSLKDMVK